MFVPKGSNLRARIARGDPLGAVWLSLGSVGIVELAARARPDLIVLDLQHGLWERTSMEHAIGIVPPETAVLVRVAENAPPAIAQALDAGAEGVIVPLVASAEEAGRAVRAARYPPAGIRSGGGVRPLADFDAYVAAAEKGIIVCVMIETETGYRNAPAIAATPGVDIVFIGTGDLALSLGRAQDAPLRLEAACAGILAACGAKGTPCGIFTPGAETARTRCREGYRLVVTASDIALVAGGFEAAVARFKGSD